MEILDFYKKKLIKKINNFPIGEKPQNAKELSAKIAVVSHIMASIDLSDVEVAQVLNRMIDINVRELFIRQMICSAYKLDENELPNLPLSALIIGTNIDYIEECIKMKNPKENIQKYIETFDILNRYIELSYDLREKRHHF